MISVHSPLHYLVSLFFCKKKNWTSRVQNKDKWLSPWSVQLQRRLELPQDFVRKYSRWSLQPTPLHALCAAHAERALLEAVRRRLELLPSSEATTPLALLGLGATHSREDYRRRARKGLPGATQVPFSVQPLAIPGK